MNSTSSGAFTRLRRQGLHIVTHDVPSLVSELWQAVNIKKGVAAQVNGQEWHANRPRYGLLPSQRAVSIESPHQRWIVKSDGAFCASVLRGKTRIGSFRLGGVYVTDACDGVDDLAAVLLTYAHDLNCLTGGPLSRWAAIEGITTH